MHTHYEKICSVHMKDLFEQDPNRFQKFSLTFNDILLDYSKNIITRDTIGLLLELAEEMELKEAVKSLFGGEPINETENRAVLHTALRNLSEKPVFTDSRDVMPEINKSLGKIKLFSDQIINGIWKGYTGKPITQIVNIGIGGSDLGPAMVCEALTHYAFGSVDVHFVSNVDGTHIAETLKGLDPETTLFMISSKSFTTQETLTNALSARDWFLEKAKETGHIEKHFIAISENQKKVEEFGIHPDNMFVLWDFVGGRYSLCSAIGLSIACYIGFDQFKALLSGAHEMDTHFETAPFDQNIPVIMGLLGIWYTNFFDAPTEAVFPYDQYLRRFPAYLQQASMESNGKHMDRNGEQVTYKTCPVLWGEPGTNGQHAFFQLLHQGTQLVPSTFLAGFQAIHDMGNHHQQLLSNFFAQTEALMNGKTEPEIREELKISGLAKDAIDKLVPYKLCRGNKPSTSILYKKLTPKVLGSLIALFEHKIFVQGIIWNIFSFDQWGVELGKQLAGNILGELTNKEVAASHDASTNGLINAYKNQCL